MDWRRDLWGVVAAAILALAAPTAALGCSPVPGYVRPSNFELIQIADAIVVATPLSEIPSERLSQLDSKVRFRVDQVLKGEAPAEIEVGAMVLGRTRPSDPNDIVYSHPEGHAGPCNRMTVGKSASYVLFLDRRGQAYAPLGYPFSRVSEDYAGEDALWTRTIRTYLRLQAEQAPMEELASLEAMRAAILADPKRSRADAALAADIDQHLGSVSRWKPTEYLLAAYADAKAGRAPRYRPRDAAFDDERSGADAFADMLMADLVGDRASAVAPPRRSALETRILASLIEGDHPAAMPLFESFAQPSSPPADLAMAIRFMAKNGRYREAYELIEARAVPLMATAARDDFFILSSAIGDAQEDPFYGEGQPRWRGDPDITVRWPKLAVKLTSLSEERFGEDPGYTETMMTLLGKDLRATPELTLALSGHSNDITNWAAAELKKPENLTASQGEAGGTAGDPLLLPLQIELRWHGVGGDDEIDGLKSAFCLGPNQRRMIFDQWGRIGGDESVHALLRLAPSPSADLEDRRVLMTAIPAWDRRYTASRGESWLAKDAAMRKLVNGEPITGADIAPLKPVRCPGA